MAIVEERKKVLKPKVVKTLNPSSRETTLVTQGVEEVEEYVRTYTGKDLEAAKGIFKEQARENLHQQSQEWKQKGSLVISDPLGRRTVIRADREEELRAHGYGVAATKAMFRVNGFSKTRRGGLRREKILYRNGERIVLLREEQ